MSKIQKNIIIFLIIIALFSVASFAHALEVQYPFIPGAGTITKDSGLGDYVGYFFGLAMYVAGILAVISFAVGAIQIIMAASNPEMETQGKDRMKGALLGLVLTLSAFVILQTINPQFVTPTLTPLPGVAGIFYAKDTENLKAAPMSEANVAALESIKDGYTNIYYKCTEGGETVAPTLLIWKFPLPNLKGTDENYSGVVVKRKKCGEMESISGAGSFKINYEWPGIYYFLEEGCSGYMSEPNTITQDITEPFTAKIKSVRIVNDPGNNKYFGAIFHSSPDATKASDCTNPVIYWDGGQDCLNLADFSHTSFETYSVEIATLGKDPTSSSGDGVWFYSNVNAWDSGNKSGVKQVFADSIKTYFMQPADSFYFKFNYAGVPTNLGKICRENPSCRETGADLSSCCYCATPNDWSAKSTSTDEEKGCGGSIKFGGNGYLVTLYTDYTKEIINADGEKTEVAAHYCQSFKKDAKNLSTGGSFLPSPDAELTRINIIPIH